MTRRTMTSLATSASAIALALSLVSAPVSAQDMQLEDSALSGLAQLGIEAPAGMMVTAEQATQIENVLGSSDPRDTQEARIREILGQNEMVSGSTELGRAQLEDSVMSSLAGLGIETSGVSLLSIEQLAQVENISSSTGEDTEKKRRIEQYMSDAGAMPAETVVGDPTHGLGDLVSSDLAKLGINDVDVDALTPDELTQIRGVTNSSDSDTLKKSRIEQIVMK